MKIHIHAQEHFEMTANIITTERDRLAGNGFTSEEISSLLWLQKWYQTGGSDRVTVVRHWEFLKLLVLNGKLEV
jgi:hypothetical protein